MASEHGLVHRTWTYSRTAETAPRPELRRGHLEAGERPNNREASAASHPSQRATAVT